MRPVLTILTALLLAVVGILYGCDRLENPQREFASVSSEVFAGGWVPKVLPASATAIRTQHNIDTNRVWVRFIPGSDQFDPEKLGFRRVQQSAWPSDPVKPRYASWWFDSLESLRGDKAALYAGSCNSEGHAGYLVVATGVAYLWCDAV